MAAQRGDIDQHIDRFVDNVFDWLGRHIRLILLLMVLAAFMWIVALPKWQVWLPMVSTGLLLLFQLLFAVLFMIVQFVALFWFLGRGRVYWVMPGETGVGFADYKGNPEVLEGARRVVTLLRGVKAFKQMGGEVIRGLLLVGPPGTGKSYLAQAISTEAGVPFGYASAPSFQNMFMGIGNLRVMMLYGKARKMARKYGACILFIDEIDAIGAARSGQGPATGFGGMMFGGNGGMLNELLMQMDPPPQEQGWWRRLLRRFGLRRGKAEMPPVLTIGATNLPEVLDQALVRPGRFDRKITVDLPDADGRQEIIEYYLGKVTHDDLPMARMVSDTIGYSPVAIKYVINEAVVHAHFDGRQSINYWDFTRAREAHEWGLRQPIKSISEEERRRLAYHETGHAFAQLKLLPRERVAKVTIIRHGGALGLMAPKPLEEMHTHTKEEILGHIQVSLASRAAEELFLNIKMTGAVADLANATQLAGALIRAFGMNGSLYSALAFGEAQPDPATKREIDKLLNTEYKKVKALLAANRDAVIAIAETLVEKDELDGDDIAAIVDRVERQRAGGVESTPTPLPVEVSASEGAKRPELPAADGDVAAFRNDRPGPGGRAPFGDGEQT